MPRTKRAKPKRTVPAAATSSGRTATGDKRLPGVARKGGKRLPGRTQQSRQNEGKRETRFRPGTVALREIRKYQKSFDMLLPLMPFRRLVREIAQDFHPEYRWTAGALSAVQEAAEVYMVQVFNDAQWCSLHAKRVTVMKKDVELTRRLYAPDL